MYSKTPQKWTLYTGIPSEPNIVCGPNSTYTYINNPFKALNPSTLDILSDLEGVQFRQDFTIHRQSKINIALMW